MLKLYSDKARHEAKQLLKRLQPQLQQLLAGQPLQVGHLHVLYLKRRWSVKHIIVTQLLCSNCICACCTGPPKGSWDHEWRSKCNRCALFEGEPLS